MTYSSDPVLLWTLFWQFGLISLLAFGGGQAVLPLIERISAQQHDWVTVPAFTASVGFGYLIPGPVTTLSTFIGYQAGGLTGALAATLGIFLAPTILAALAAASVERFAKNRWLRAFSAGAVPAVAGLLVATFVHIAQQSLTSWPLAGIALVGLGISAKTKIQPLWILLGGGILGLWMG